MVNGLHFYSAFQMDSTVPKRFYTVVLHPLTHTLIYQFSAELPYNGAGQTTGSNRRTQSFLSGPGVEHWQLQHTDKMAWMQFDEDLNGILDATLSGPIHSKVDSLTTIAYNLAKYRTMEQKGQPQNTATKQDGEGDTSPETK